MYNNKNLSPRLLAAVTVSLSTLCLSSLAQAETQSQDFVPITLKPGNEQAEAKGFIDGQSLSGSTRNWYAREGATRAPLFRY